MFRTLTSRIIVKILHANLLYVHLISMLRCVCMRACMCVCMCVCLCCASAYIICNYMLCAYILYIAYALMHLCKCVCLCVYVCRTLYAYVCMCVCTLCHELQRSEFQSE